MHNREVMCPHARSPSRLTTNPLPAFLPFSLLTRARAVTRRSRATSCLHVLQLFAAVWRKLARRRNVLLVAVHAPIVATAAVNALSLAVRNRGRASVCVCVLGRLATASSKRNRWALVHCALHAIASMVSADSAC